MIPARWWCDSGKMKQTIVIERKSFKEDYDGNDRVLHITERRHAFSTSICFRARFIPWFCDVVDQACREIDPSAVVCSKRL